MPFFLKIESLKWDFCLWQSDFCTIIYHLYLSPTSIPEKNCFESFLFLRVNKFMSRRDKCVRSLESWLCSVFSMAMEDDVFSTSWICLKRYQFLNLPLEGVTVSVEGGGRARKQMGSWQEVIVKVLVTCLLTVLLKIWSLRCIKVSIRSRTLGGESWCRVLPAMACFWC